MRAAIGQIALKQIGDQLFHFRITQGIVRFDGMTANCLRDHILAQAQGGAAVARALEPVDHFAHERHRV